MNSTETTLAWTSSRGRWLLGVGIELSLGLLFLIAPERVMTWLGVPASDHTAMVFRLYGLMIFYKGLIFHVLHGHEDPTLRRGHVFSNLIFGVGSAALLGWATVAGLVNSLGWVLVAVFVLEAIGNVIALFSLRDLPGRSANERPALSES